MQGRFTGFVYGGSYFFHARAGSVVFSRGFCNGRGHPIGGEGKPLPAAGAAWLLKALVAVLRALKMAG